MLYFRKKLVNRGFIEAVRGGMVIAKRV